MRQAGQAGPDSVSAMLLSDRDLRAEIESGALGLDPFDPTLIQPASIDVRLDRFFRVFNNSKYTHIDPQLQQDELTSLVEVEPTMSRSSCIRASSCWDRPSNRSPCRTPWQVDSRASRHLGASVC